jgi:hypothetical protein
VQFFKKCKIVEFAIFKFCEINLESLGPVAYGYIEIRRIKFVVNAKKPKFP